MYQQSAPETIQAMFASIAGNYDRANTAFTFGLHKRWNQQLIDTFAHAKCLLDLCAGTGEIAFGFLKKNQDSEAILLDFCAEMLAVAQKKGGHYHNRFEVIQADAQAIPLADASVDAVSISYGIRNVKKPEQCFQEVYRVLAKNGRFGILELTRPTSRLIRTGHQCYTRVIVPLLGRMLTKNKEAYQYLVKSVDTFATPSTIETSLKSTGFKNIQLCPLMGGIATLFTANKPFVVKDPDLLRNRDSFKQFMG